MRHCSLWTYWINESKNKLWVFWAGQKFSITALIVDDFLCRFNDIICHDFKSSKTWKDSYTIRCLWNKTTKRSSDFENIAIIKFLTNKLKASNKVSFRILLYSLYNPKVTFPLLIICLYTKYSFRRLLFCYNIFMKSLLFNTVLMLLWSVFGKWGKRAIAKRLWRLYLEPNVKVLQSHELTVAYSTRIKNVVFLNKSS